MSVKQVAIRLKPEGGTETVRMFREAEQAGVKTQDSTAAASDRASAALDRQTERWRRMAQANREAYQAAREQSSWATAFIGGGVNLSPASDARLSADVFREHFRAMDDQAAAAGRLKAAIDPLAAAQDRYNAELMEARSLHAAGAISARELAAAEGLLKNRLESTTAMLAARNGGLTRLQSASRLNLARQGADVFTTAAMGMSPAMIAIQQGPQIMDAWSTSGIKVNAAMVALYGSIGLVAGAAVAMGAAWLDAESRMVAAERAASGVGRTAGLTGQGLRDLARDAAETGDVSNREADRLAAAYVSTGRIGGETIRALIEHHRDLASFLGLEAEDAQRALAQAMMDPVRAAQEMTGQFGLLDLETLDLIDSLKKQGDQMGAQRILLDALTQAAEGHAARVSEIESAWDGVGRAISDAWHWLGEFLHTTDAERLAELDRVLSPTIGTPMPDHIRRQLWQERTELQEAMWAEQVRANEVSARATANQRALRERQEEDARRRRGRSGGRSAEREAERAAREALRLERAHEDARAGLELELARIDANDDLLRRLDDQARVRGRIRWLMDAGADADSASLIANSELLKVNAARERAMARFLESETDALLLQRARMVGDHATARMLEDRVAREGRIVELQRQGLSLAKARALAEKEAAVAAETRQEISLRDLAADDRTMRLALADARGDWRTASSLEAEAWIERRAREIERLNSGTMNLGDGDEQAIREWGELLEAHTEGAFRSGARSLIDALEDGGVEGALDRIFETAADRLGDDLADILGSFLHQLSQGSGVGGFIGKAAGWLFDIPGNARGTDFWDGGWTWVGEEGPELIRAPRGSKIRDHGRSMAMTRQAAGSAGGVIDVRVSVAPSPLLEAEVQAQAQGAAVRVVRDATGPILREAASQAGPASVDYMKRERILEGA